MNRAQINDQFQSDRLHTQARPGFDPVAAPRPRWEGLGEVFAKGEMMAKQWKEQKDDEDKLRAQRTANSMTVGELGKKIQAGEMLASESPVFAATLQNIFGSNAQAALERDVISKITTGEMKFNNPEEIDLFITEQRNTSLAGHSKYAAAGFDRNHAAMRQKFMDATKQTVDKQAVETAAAQATDALSNTLLKVTAGDYTGNHQDAAQALLKDYELLRKSYTLPPGADRAALTEVIQRAASSGHKELVKALLDAPERDLGSVRNIIGEAKAATLAAHAEGKYDEAMRQQVDADTLSYGLQADEGRLNEDAWLQWATAPERAKYTTQAGIRALLERNRAAQARQQAELARAQREVQAGQLAAAASASVTQAVAVGRLFEVDGTNKPQVMDSAGNLKDADVRGMAVQAAKRLTQGLPLDKQAAVWATNGITHPDWQNLLQAGLSNIASLGATTPGKPAGKLNDQARQALQLFHDLDNTQPYYLRRMLGEGYEPYADMAFLMKLGQQPDVAAAMVANAQRGDVSSEDAKVVANKVSTAVAEWSGNPFYKAAWAQRLLGDNTNANTAQLTDRMRRMATLLARSGLYPTADSALEQAATYLTDPRVSAKVNGTLYMRTEMPTAPAGEQAEDWLDKFITDGPKAQAIRQGFKGSEVRLEYSPSENGYRAFVVGVPLTDDQGEALFYNRTTIEQWYGDKRREDINEATSNVLNKDLKRPFSIFRARLEDELTKDVNVHADVLRHRKHLLTEATFTRIVADGNQDKPLQELMRMYPTAASAPKAR